MVSANARAAQDRAELRRAAGTLRLGELREGVWMRPDNLERSRQPDDTAVMRSQARRLVAQPDDDGELPDQLWDLQGWNRSAVELRRQMSRLHRRLDDDDTDALAPGFLLAAAVLRHLNDDPVLPRELVPRHGQGDRLRSDYEGYNASYSALLTRWLRAN